MESRNDVVWAKGMEPYSCAWLCMVWDGGECRGSHCTRGFFIDDSVLLVLKAQRSASTFHLAMTDTIPPCTRGTESTETADNYEHGPISSKTTLGGQALARMVANGDHEGYSVLL